MNTQQNFSRWLESPKVSPAMKEEMRKMSLKKSMSRFLKTSNSARPACAEFSAPEQIA